jgi:hypothetical protein
MEPRNKPRSRYGARTGRGPPSSRVSQAGFRAGVWPARPRPDSGPPSRARRSSTRLGSIRAAVVPRGVACGGRRCRRPAARAAAEQPGEPPPAGAASPPPASRGVHLRRTGTLQRRRSLPLEALQHLPKLGQRRGDRARCRRGLERAGRRWRRAAPQRPAQRPARGNGRQREREHAWAGGEGGKGRGQGSGWGRLGRHGGRGAGLGAGMRGGQDAAAGAGACRAACGARAWGLRRCTRGDGMRRGAPPPPAPAHMPVRASPAPCTPPPAAHLRLSHASFASPACANHAARARGCDLGGGCGGRPGAPGGAPPVPLPLRSPLPAPPPLAPRTRRRGRGRTRVLGGRRSAPGCCCGLRAARAAIRGVSKTRSRPGEGLLVECEVKFSQCTMPRGPRRRHRGPAARRARHPLCCQPRTAGGAPPPPPPPPAAVPPRSPVLRCVCVVCASASLLCKSYNLK